MSRKKIFAILIAILFVIVLIFSLSYYNEKQSKSIKNYVKNQEKTNNENEIIDNEDILLENYDTYLESDELDNL